MHNTLIKKGIDSLQKDLTACKIIESTNNNRYKESHPVSDQAVLPCVPVLCLNPADQAARMDQATPVA